MTFLKKKWPMIVLAILLLLPMALAMADMEMPRDVLLEPVLNSAVPLGEFRDSVPVEQVFVAPAGEISAVEIQIGTYMRENHFTLRAELMEYDSQTPLAAGEIDTSGLVDNAYAYIDFDPVEVRAGERYVLALCSEGASETNTVTVYRGEDGSATEDSYARVDGQNQSYALAFRVVEPSSRLSRFVVFLILAFFVVLAGGIWALSKKLPWETVFSILALGLGLLYMFAIAPLNIPDGQYHYVTSYRVSSAILGQRVDGVDYAEAEDFAFSSFSEGGNTANGYRRVSSELGGRDRSDERIPIPINRYDQYFIQELPSGLGITLARALGFNFVTTLMMGRLFNLVFFVICVYFAVKRIPRYKTALGLAALVPMSLQQAASCSYDCFIDGVSLFLIASILKAVYDDGPISRRDYLCILVAGVLLAPAKVIYTVLLLLCLLIPWERFGSKKKKIIGIGLIFLCAVIFILAFQLSALGNLAASGDSFDDQGSHHYTLNFAFSHPLRTAMIFARTFLTQGGWYFNTMLGSSLGSLALSIPTWIIKSFTLVIFLSILNQKESLPAVHRVAFLLVVAVVTALAMASMFLAWTRAAASVIEGVQGRYLLPVLPLMVFALSDTLMLKRDMDRELVVTFVLLHGNVIANILSYTTAH